MLLLMLNDIVEMSGVHVTGSVLFQGENFCSKNVYMVKRQLVQSLTLTVCSLGTDFYFLPWYDMYSSHVSHWMMNLPHLGAKRASTQSRVSHPPPAMCPCDWWLYPAMLNHNWILLLPSWTSMPRRLMKFEWVLQQQKKKKKRKKCNLYFEWCVQK